MVMLVEKEYGATDGRISAKRHCFDLHPVRAHHSCDYISGMTGDG